MNNDALIQRLGNIFERHYANKIAFRPINRCDAFPLFVATRDQNFNAFLLWDTPNEEIQTIEQIDKLIRENTLRRVVALSICDRMTGAWWGYVVIKPFRDGAELSLYLHPSVWNKGIVFAAGCAAIELIMLAAPDAPIYNRVHESNVRMRKICRGYGFEKVDEEDMTHTSGHDLKVEVYRLNKDKWTPVEVSKY